MIVFKYRLKFFGSRDCLYCQKDAFVKIICAFGAPMLVTLLFVSNNFLVFVSNVQRIFRSIFTGKFILPYVPEVSYWEPIGVFVLKVSFKLYDPLCQIWICYVSRHIASINYSAGIRAVKDNFFFAVEKSFSIFFRAFCG